MGQGQGALAWFFDGIDILYFLVKRGSSRGGRAFIVSRRSTYYAVLQTNVCITTMAYEPTRTAYLASHMFT